MLAPRHSAARPASSNKAWLRALELTAPIPRNPHRIFPTVIEELAEKYDEAPALLSERECLTYRALAERSTRYTRWALDQGLAKGSIVQGAQPTRQIVEGCLDPCERSS